MVDVRIGSGVAVTTASSAAADVCICDSAAATVTLGSIDTVSITASGSSADVCIGDFTEVIYTQLPAYDGSYSVTPSASAQTLRTSGKRMTADITVQPIPSNYGRIEWNGSYLSII